MGKAEFGTPKYIANQMKSKGLQRLRWYCQVCEKQCRDENGFKCHTQSESHLRQMLLVGENPQKKIEEYSNQFLKDFLQLLKSSHQEKFINVNKFYQEYIANKEHIHMNATKWSSLSQFATYLGNQKLCRVRESEQEGLCIAWIDNSPRALEMKNILLRKKHIETTEEMTKDHLLQKQISLAQKHNEKAAPISQKQTPKELKATNIPVKITLGNKILKKTPLKKNIFKIAK